VELLEAPGVGLVEVDGGAEEEAGGELVVLPTGRLVGAAPGREVVAQEAGQFPGGRRGRLSGVVELTPQVAVGRKAAGEPPVEVIAARVGPGLELLGRLDDLGGGADVAGVGRREQRALVLLDGPGEPVHPGGDVGHRLLAVGGHQVEGRTRLVEGAGDHVDLARDLARVVALEPEAQPLLHGGLGHPLGLGLGNDGAQGGEGPPLQVGFGRVALGGEIVELGVVADDAHHRGVHRAQGGPVFDVLVGEIVDSSHATDIRPGL
jgi:hypothetical protein